MNKSKLPVVIPDSPKRVDEVRRLRDQRQHDIDNVAPLMDSMEAAKRYIMTRPYWLDATEAEKASFFEKVSQTLETGKDLSVDVEEQVAAQLKTLSEQRAENCRLPLRAISGPRYSGKTIEAIKLANKQGCYLVVRSPQEATRVFHQHRRDPVYPKVDRFPITYRELLESRGGPYIIGYVIDDIGAFLREVVKDGKPVIAFTLDEEH